MGRLPPSEGKTLNTNLPQILQTDMDGTQGTFPLPTRIQNIHHQHIHNVSQHQYI